jgi:hypothetical protein
VTAAFAAMVAACIAVTKAGPEECVLFAIFAVLLSNIKALRRITPAAVPLLMGSCLLALPLKQTLLIYICCIITAFIKKNFYYSLPLLLTLTLFCSVFGSAGESSPYGFIGLILLLPLAAGVCPADRVKGLCTALAVSLPVSFGFGRTQAIALLLPALIPVLMQGGRRIQSFREE